MNEKESIKQMRHWECDECGRWIYKQGEHEITRLLPHDKYGWVWILQCGKCTVDNDLNALKNLVEERWNKIPVVAYKIREVEI